MNLHSLKAWIRKPQFWLVLTAVFYTVFEIINATVACNSANILAFTGLFSFLGFWTLVAMGITGMFMNPTKKFDYRWALVAVVIIISLTTVEYFFARTCDLETIWPR